MSTQIQIVASSENFANADLTFTGDRIHNGDGYSLSFAVDAVNYDKGQFELGAISASFGFNASYAAFATNYSRLYANGSIAVNATTSGVHIGSSATPSAQLDVRAQGYLSTDIAFRVRNSGNTQNIFAVRGDGVAHFNNSASGIGGIYVYPSSSYGTTMQFSSQNTNVFIKNDDSSAPTWLARGFSVHNAGIVGSATAKINHSVKSGLEAYGAGYGFNWAFTADVNGYFSQSERAMWLNPNKAIVLYTGTGSISDPHGELGDSFQMYSADIVAGNAAPHFRTEAGDIIKLFKGTALTAPDGTLANAVTRIAELEARLQAHGLIA